MRPILATLLLLSACAAPDGAVLPRSTASASRPTFATQLAGPFTFLPPMPTAVVILKPGDLNRSRAFCQAFQQLPTAQQATAASVVAPNLVLTRWLTQLPAVSPANATDCDFLVGTYDYARAAALLGNVSLGTGTLSGRGPFLLMVIADGSGLHVAGLDGSAYEDTGFAPFIATWAGALQSTARQVTQAANEPPGLARSMFNLVAAILRTALNAGTGLLSGTLRSL